jgi:hypothetical protein
MLMPWLCPFQLSLTHTHTHPYVRTDGHCSAARVATMYMCVLLHIHLLQAPWLLRRASARPDVVAPQSMVQGNEDAGELLGRLRDKLAPQSKSSRPCCPVIPSRGLGHRSVHSCTYAGPAAHSLQVHVPYNLSRCCCRLLPQSGLGR